MKQIKRRSNGISIGLPLIIVIAIALCMIFLINFTNAKFEELLNSSTEGLLIHHDPDNPVHQELAEKLSEFRPEACKLIEVYSNNFEPIFSVQFKNGNPHGEEDLSSYTDLVELLREHPEGHTVLTIDDIEEDVYFRWVDASDDESYLVIIYMSRPIVYNLWAFSFVCYLVIILLFTLVAVLVFSRHHDRIREYQQLVNQTKECPRNKYK